MLNKVDGFVGVLVQDSYPESPREWDNLGTIYTSQRGMNRYGIGEEVIDENVDQWLHDILESGAVILNVYLYDHSMVSVSTKPFYGRAQHAAWDSGLYGFIVAHSDEIRKSFNKKRISAKLRKRVEEILAAEIDAVDQWLRGDVWDVGQAHEVWVREGSELTVVDYEIVDLCGGHFGYEYAKEALLSEYSDVDQVIVNSDRSYDQLMLVDLEDLD